MLCEQWTFGELVAKKSSYLQFGLGLGFPSFYQSECVDTAEDETTNFINHLITKTTPKNMSNI